MNITLDCTLITDDQTAHDVFAQALSFPATYGRTLDALYDMLTSTGELNLTLTNAGALSKLFRYGDNLKLTLEDAAKDNELFTLEYQD